MLHRLWRPDPCRTRLRPTRYGVLFMVVLAGLLIGAVNYANNLAYLLTFQLAGMMLVSAVIPYRCLSGIQASDIRTMPVFAGEEAVIEALLTGLPDHSFQLQLAFENAEGSENPVSKGKPTTLRAVVPTHRRGRLKLGAPMLTTRFPFGLVEARRQLPESVDCIVYPRPTECDLPTSGSLSASGNGRSSVPAGSDDFAGLRHYQPGDNLRHVSWKTYSRGLGLLTKAFTGFAGWTEMLDYHRLNHDDVEQRLGCLCHLVLLAGRQQRRFGLQLPGLTILPDRGPAHQRRCLEALALLDTEGN